MNTLEIGAILELLPHRYPFLLIDRVLQWSTDEGLTALKNVTINEPFFNGHFPHHPVMPGVLIIEALAQAAALLSFLTEEVKAHQEGLYYLVGLDHVRIKRPVVPGDTLILNAKLLKSRKNLLKYAGTAYVGDELAASAELLATFKLP